MRKTLLCISMFVALGLGASNAAAQLKSGTKGDDTGGKPGAPTLERPASKPDSGSPTIRPTRTLTKPAPTPSKKRTVKPTEPEPTKPSLGSPTTRPQQTKPTSKRTSSTRTETKPTETEPTKPSLGSPTTRPQPSRPTTKPADTTTKSRTTTSKSSTPKPTASPTKDGTQESLGARNLSH